MKILKFGGLSISTIEGLQQVEKILAERVTVSRDIVVVVSALIDATDALLRMSHLAARSKGEYEPLLAAFEAQHRTLIAAAFASSGADRVRADTDTLLADLRNALHGISLVCDVSPKALEHVVGFGERISALILSEFLRPRFSGCRLQDARDVIAGGCSGIVVVPGTRLRTDPDEPIVAGRGGADFIVGLLASSLDCDEIELWTAVDGIMTADPKKVNRAFSIPALSYEEALELGHFGAEVLFVPALQPASNKGIPIRVRNTFRPEQPGSIISDEPPGGEFPITGISSISNIALYQLQGSGLIGISGTAKRLFDALSAENINVILISQASSEHSICFALSPVVSERAAEAVKREFVFEIDNRLVELLPPEEEHSIVAAVGANMRHRSGIAGKLFQALGKNGISVAAIAQGSSELNISVVVARSDESKALNALHDAFFLSEQKTIHLFLAGTGRVGEVLLEQIAAQRIQCAQRGLELRIAGLMNSRTMMLTPDGIGTDTWRAALEQSTKKSDIVAFVKAMRMLNLPNSIFVDCTASEDVAATYLPVLSSSISIVTPNKRANSASLERYRELKARAERANVKFFYETTVGAGLPIIGTLNDLIASGDEIIRIEAVLSGTLSFIFNTYRAGVPFSDVVRDAQARSYTEPDPRDDLSGRDVARKLIILGREIGLALEEGDIRVESLADRLDGELEALRANAENNGEVLRYIAHIEGTRAEVSLKSVGPSHPFYSLSGTDNVVSFTTKRYFDRPLVVKGPGAGTAVTAAGVLADILRVASYLV